MSQGKHVLLAAGVVLFFATLASSAPVGFNQVVSVEGSELNATGDLIARELHPFTLIYHPTSSPTPVEVRASLASAVYRDTASGHLTFTYGIADLIMPINFLIPFSPFGETSGIGASSFGNFATDVAGDAGGGSVGSRSADGKSVGVHNTSPGNSGPPHMVVRTDALGFDRGGSVTIGGSAEITFGDFQHASANISGTFQPAGNVAAVPLPPALWGGLATLGIGCIGKRWSRRA